MDQDDCAKKKEHRTEMRLNNRRPMKNNLPPWKRLAVRLATLVAAALLLSLPTSPVSAHESAAAVSTGTIHYDSSGFQIEAFIAKPATGGKHPAVLVLHDAQGLTDAIRDVARQLAAAGYVAMAPDFASRLGGKRAPEQMAQDVARLTPNATVGDARAAFDSLQKDSDVDAAKISTVGFGWGAWRSFMLADSAPDLYRAVIYCGTTPSQNFDTLRAPVLGHYAQFDFRTTGNALVTEKTMAEAGKKFTYFVYSQSYRGFYFPGAQYNAEAANQAWKRTLDFLK
jgi:carboxymethylenebutenolidase